MIEQLKIDESVYTGSKEDEDLIKTAIEKLSIASQEQFEDIKREKWYNRVFDMVTFSQKGKKRLAEQISTVAQAQQIFLELLLRISSDNADISRIVAESMENIRKITEQNIYLLSRINHLEDVTLGIKSDMDISKLSFKEKQVLCAYLYWLNDNYGGVSENQTKFANVVINYLNVDVQMDNPATALKDMDNNSKRRILACCLEYIFLGNCSFLSFEEYEDFVEEFDFGGKTIKELKKQIESLYRLRGCEGFFAKYATNNCVEIDNMFFVEFEDDFSEDEKNDFNMVELSSLQLLMKKYDIIKTDEGYRELTNKYFDILPDAYLGKNSLFAIYFTVAGLYIRLEDNEWIEMKYDELCPEKIMRDNSEEKDKISLTVKDVKGNSFRYTADEKSCNEFTDLIFALKDAKISGDDKYYPIFCRETYFYGEILIDFLKLGDHNSVAALKKCSEIMMDEEADKDIAFKEIFEYAFLDYKVTEESLKGKILEWKKTINPCAVNLYMAILVKDLVEILQLASGEPSAMTSVEKYFLDWLMREAGIEDTNKFLEMIRLPYCLISKGGKRYIGYDTISEVEKYAYKEQMHIPYHILDNEKLGLWSSLYKITKENDDPLGFLSNKIETFLNHAEWIVYFEFCASMYTFLEKVYSLEGILFTSNDINDFLMKCGFTEYFEEIVEEELYNFLEDDNWKNVWQKFFDDDRRTLGMEMVNEFFLDKNYRKKKATIRASKRYNSKFQEFQKHVNMLKENDFADNYNVYGKTSEEYQNAVNTLIEIYESEINDLDRKKERTYTQFEYKKLIVNSHAELSLERFAFDEEGDICFMIGDITWLKVDCIVNATYSLLGEGGIAKEIHMAAGPELLEECIKLKKCTVGETKITKGYNLNAKYIIHMIIPKHTDKKRYIEELRNCYKNTLELAKKNNIHTIAFPTLSTEFKEYQVNEICETVLRVISSWQNDNPEYPLFVVICNHSEETYNAYKRAEEKIDKEFLKKLGFHNLQKCFEIVKDGEPGVLVWDYFLYNEISFLANNTLKSESLFKSMSDSKTEKEFERLSRKYGISNES